MLLSADKYSRNESLQISLVSASVAGQRGRAPPPPRRTDGHHCNTVPRRGSTPSSPASHPPSIIVLHETPMLVVRGPTYVAPTVPEDTSWGNWRTSRQRSRQTRRTSRRRRDSIQLLQEGDYPEMLLSPGALETIVINNGAYFVQAGHPTHHHSQSTLQITSVTYDDDDNDGVCRPRPPPPPPSPPNTTSAINRTEMATDHQ